MLLLYNYFFISILQKANTRLRVFKELVCGQNIDPLSEESGPGRLTPELPGQWRTISSNSRFKKRLLVWRMNQRQRTGNIIHQETTTLAQEVEKAGT